MATSCPACGAFLPAAVLHMYGETEVYEQKCSKCGTEVDDIPGMFIE